MKIKNILIYLLLFFSFGIPLSFGNSEETTTGAGTTEESPASEEETEISENTTVQNLPSEYSGIKNLIITKNKDVEDLKFKNVENSELNKYIDFKYIDIGLNLSEVIYKYTNKEGETIIFGQGYYCNITSGTCKNFYHHRLGSSNFDNYYKIIEHNDYIIFYYYGHQSSGYGPSGNVGNYLYIYNKKLDKFLNLDLNYISSFYSFTDFLSNEGYINNLESQANYRGIKQAYNVLKANNSKQSFFNTFGKFSNRKYGLRFSNNVLYFTLLKGNDILFIYKVDFSLIPENFFKNDSLYNIGIDFKNLELKNIENIKLNFEGRNDYMFTCRFLKGYCGINQNNINNYSEEYLQNIRPLTKNDFDIVFFERKNDNLNYAYFGPNHGFSYYNKTKIPGINGGFMFSRDYDGVNFEKSYFNKDLVIEMVDKSVLYFFDGAGIFTGYGGHLKKASNTGDNLLISGIFSNETFQDFWNYFRNFKVLSFGYSSFYKKHYISYIKKPSVGNWTFHILTFKNFEELQNGSYDIIDGLYNIGFFGYFGVFVDETLFKNGFIYLNDGGYYKDTQGIEFINSDIYYSPFFISRFGNNYHFYILAKNGKIVKSEKPLFNFRFDNSEVNTDLGFVFSDYILKRENLNTGVNNNGKTGNKLTETGEGEYKTDNEAIEDFERLKRDSEATKRQFNKYFGDIPFINQVFGVINFSFPEDWNKRVIIPFIKPNIRENRLVVEYETRETNLKPIEDKLKINYLGSDTSGIGKKIISFFLAFFYIVVCFLFFSFPFFYIFLIYKLLGGVKNVFFPYIESKETKGNLLTLGIYVSYIILFISFIIPFATIGLIFTGFLGYVKDVIILIFGFLNYNFFDLETFKNVITVFNTGFITAFIGYIGLKIALSFGKLF